VHEVALVGGGANRTTVRLAESWCRLGLRARLVTGRELSALEVGDVAVGRLDVLPELDGVEPGLFELFLLERRGVDVRNTAAALIAAHDKLRTTRLLAAAGIPQPQTEWVRSPGDRIEVGAPLVVKPRFGSWGKDVHRCDTEREARELLRRLAGRSWFRRHGALVQELVPPRGRDLRVLVAGGRVIGAAERTAASGEWRTNVSLGGHKAHADTGPQTEALALAAARALGCDLVAVDLLLLPGGGFVVLELNAAADFDDDYVWPGGDADADVARALGLSFTRRPRVDDPPTEEGFPQRVGAG
jgi:RimK family alpha-L-glutamate ligase